MEDDQAPPSGSDRVSRTPLPTTGKIRVPSTQNSVFWVLLARQSERLIGIISVAILARALAPEDFGLVAMATSVVAIIEVFSAFGFDWAVVRVKHPTPQHYHTAWSLRVVLGLLLALTMLAVAMPAAAFFRREEIAGIMVIFALVALVGAVENSWMAEYRRTGDFIPEFRQRIGAKVVGFIVAVGIAIIYRSYWALVFGTLAARLTATVLTFTLHPGRPRWDLSMRSELLSFSGWIFVDNLAGTLRTRFADIWVGRQFGLKSAGLYSLSSELSTLATTEIAAPINRAIFGRYAAQADDKPALRAAFLKVSGFLWLLGMPVAIGLGVCAPWVLDALFGSQWHDAAPILQILAIAGLFEIVGANTHYVYWAMGRSRFVTMLTGVGTITFIALAVVGAKFWGLLGVAAAHAVASALVVSLNLIALFPMLEMSFANFIGRKWRVCVAGAIMGAAVHSLIPPLLVLRPDIPSLIVLLAAALLGGAVYSVVLTGIWVLSGRPAGPEADAFEGARDAIRRRRE